MRYLLIILLLSSCEVTPTEDVDPIFDAEMYNCSSAQDWEADSRAEGYLDSCRNTSNGFNVIEGK